MPQFQSQYSSLYLIQTAVDSMSVIQIITRQTMITDITTREQLAEVVKKHGKLLFVDAVSAMGGVELKVDKWDLDICFASSQKCLGIPPGLAIATVSEEALRKSEKAKNKGWYFDFKLFERYQKQESSTPMTPVKIPFSAQISTRVLKRTRSSSIPLRSK
jgi:aspartate aminotransferase-like enzyme